MAVLRPAFIPTVGMPQAVQLKPKRRGMSNPMFYREQVERPQPALTEPQAPQAPEEAQQFSSQDHIVSQFQRLAGRSAVPELEPGARVKSPNMELVQPSNFQTFYNRLAAIKEQNEHLLGAAQARSAFQRMQSLQANMSAAVGGGGSSKNYGSATGAVPSNPQANFKFAQNIAGNFGWNNPTELGAWYTLGMKESGWRNTAQNPTSTAYGIGQFLDATWKGYGIPKTSDPALQVEAMARYIKARYGSPSRALAFHLKNNWY